MAVAAGLFHYVINILTAFCVIVVSTSHRKTITNCISIWHLHVANGTSPIGTCTLSLVYAHAHTKTTFASMMCVRVVSSRIPIKIF